MFEGKSPLTTFVLLAAIVAGCAGTPVRGKGRAPLRGF
jgi:hypothetical protein